MGLPPVSSGQPAPISSGQVSPSTPPIDKKIEEVSQSALKNIYNTSKPSFGAKLYQLESWIADKLNLLWTSIFPNKMQKKANEIGLSSYSGERNHNLKFEGESKISSDFSIPVHVDAKKSIQRQFKGLDYKDKPVANIEQKITKMGTEFKVHSQWAKDFDRTRELRIDGEKFYHIDDDLSSEQKEFLEFNAYSKLSNYFKEAAFFNLGSILNQTLMGDFVDLLGARLNNQVRDLGRGEVITVEQERGMTMHVNEKEDDTVHITIRLPMKISASGEHGVEEIGYMAVERKIILTKKDLQTDWRQHNENIAPSLVVMDTVSRYASTSEAAMRHLKLLSSSEQMVKPS